MSNMAISNQQPQLSSELEKKLKACTSLPSLPSVAIKIIEMSKDPDIGLGEVSTIISSDPAISAKLLKVVNSPMYSQRRAVNNLREALTLLGFNAALTITLSFSLIQSLKSNEQNNASQENYWKRSILSASIARLLGTRLGLSKLEDLFLVGLLQDIGILVLENIEQSPYLEYEANALNHAERIMLEQKLLGVEHSQIGAWLLNSWNLPVKIVSAVKYSHSLNNKETEHDNVTDRFHLCLSLSGNLADIWLEESPDELLLATRDAAQIMLGIDTDEFDQLIADINNELPKIATLFDVNLKDEIARGRVLDEARELSLERSIHFIKQSEEALRHVESIEEQVKDIEEESRYDHLTKVYNRKYIERLMAEEFEHANMNRWPLSLAFIDIDNFKMVNDTHGHLVGDNVLISIADFISANKRQTDILARYGGDEFILMLPGATSDIAEGMLKRLIQLQSEKLKVNIEGQLLETSISIGLATHMDKTIFDNMESFLGAADEALYKAKDAGRNCLGVY